MTCVTVFPIREQNLESNLGSYVRRISAGQEWYASRSDYPRLDLFEDDTKLYVDIELPGYRKEDIKITVDDGVLTLSGERKPNRREGHRFVYRESGSGSFNRSVRLPVEVDASRAEAKYTDGVLHIVMPKSNPRDIQRTIDVR